MKDKAIDSNTIKLKYDNGFFDLVSMKHYKELKNESKERDKEDRKKSSKEV